MPTDAQFRQQGDALPQLLRQDAAEFLEARHTFLDALPGGLRQAPHPIGDGGLPDLDARGALDHEGADAVIHRQELKDAGASVIARVAALLAAARSPQAASARLIRNRHAQVERLGRFDREWLAAGLTEPTDEPLRQDAGHCRAEEERLNA